MPADTSERDLNAELDRFPGSVFLVTGASRGIGRAIALEAGRRGARVIIHYGRSADAAGEVVAEIRSGGGHAAAVQGTWGDAASVRSCVRHAWDCFGTIDVLVNNVGTNHKRRFVETSTEEWDDIYSVNVRGTLVCTQEAVRRMVRDGVEGRVLTITSVNAIRPGEGFAIYGGAKAWLEMSMKNIALELAPHGIRVNTFPVGAVNTDMTRAIRQDPERLEAVNRGIAMRRMADPTEIARAVVAFAGGAGDYATGASIVLDGGLSLVRGIPDLMR